MTHSAVPLALSRTLALHLFSKCRRNLPSAPSQHESILHPLHTAAVTPSGGPTTMTSRSCKSAGSLSCLLLLNPKQFNNELLAEVMRQADSSKVQNIEQEYTLVDRFPDIFTTMNESCCASRREIQSKVL